MQVKTKGDESALKKWGEGKPKVDVMEYKMWLLDDLQEKRKQAQKVAKKEVRNCSACAYS